MLVKQLFHCIIINLKIDHRTGIVHDSLVGKLFRICHMLMEWTNPYIDSKCIFFTVCSVLPDDFFPYPLWHFAKQWKTRKFLLLLLSVLTTSSQNHVPWVQRLQFSQVISAVYLICYWHWIPVTPAFSWGYFLLWCVVFTPTVNRPSRQFATVIGFYFL